MLLIRKLIAYGNWNKAVRKFHVKSGIPFDFVFYFIHPHSLSLSTFLFLSVFIFFFSLIYCNALSNFQIACLITGDVQGDQYSCLAMISVRFQRQLIGSQKVFFSLISDPSFTAQTCLNHKKVYSVELKLCACCWNPANLNAELTIYLEQHCLSWWSFAATIPLHLFIIMLILCAALYIHRRVMGLNASFNVRIIIMNNVQYYDAK